MRNWIKVPGRSKKDHIVAKIFCLLFAFLLFHANAAAQQNEKKITVEFKNERLSSVLKKIETASGYKIIFNHEDIAPYNVTAKIINKSASDALSEVIGNKPLSYKIEGKFITIAFKHNSQDPKQESKTKSKVCRISGIVIDGNKQPLPGAHIYVENTQWACNTDINGEFSVLVDNGAHYTLKASYLGMETKRINITVEESITNKKVAPIILKENDELLNEVVITGYQVMSRRESASAITSVKAKDVLTPNAMSIDQMLQGKIPGMMVMSQSGEPSSTPTIRIRGNSTINGNKGPVWVVDGVIMPDVVPFTASDLNSPDAAYLIGNGISGLSPQDIESIDVLKDASATAIYGVKAANGVIVITTKKGQPSRPVVTYDGNITINTRPTYGDFDMMNSQERIQLSKDIYDARLQYPRVPMQESFEGAMQLLISKKISQEEFGQLVQKYETMNTNWFKEIFRTTATQNHNISVNGGTEKVRYYTSLSYNNSPGIALGSKSERFTALGKLFVKINKIFDADLKINMSTQTNDGYSKVNPFSYAYNTSRAISPYDDNHNLYYYSKTSGTPISYNILNELQQTGKQNTTDQFGGVFNINARLFKGFTYTGTISYYWTNTRMKTWATDRSYEVGSIRGYDYGAYSSDDGKYASSSLPFGGTYDDSHNSSRSYTVRNTINYIEQFNEKHDINLFAGIEIRSDKYDGIATSSFGWDPLYGQSFSPVMTDSYLTRVKNGFFTPTITQKVTQVASYIGSASYTFDDRYVLNGNIRSDGSNKFGSNPKYRWLPTWSVAGKWIISNEKFMKNLDFVSLFALRGSYGIQGNIHDDATPNLIVQMDKFDEVSGIRKGTIKRLPNPDLRWEKTKSYNIGADIFLFDRRLNVTVDYYRKYTSDLITDMRVSPITGRTYMYMNAGEAFNKGIEGSISADLIRNKAFEWNLSLNFSHNTNEIRYAYDANLSDQETYQKKLQGNVAIIGQPLGTIYSFSYQGLSSTNGYPLFQATDGRKVHAGDYQVLVMEPSGTIYPDISGGIDTRFTFKKNLTLSIGFSYQLGAVKRLPAIYNEAGKAFDPSANLPQDFTNRWKQPGDEQYTNIPGLYDESISNSFPEELLALYDAGRVCDMGMTGLYDYSNLRVANSNFLRLRSLMLSYRLPTKWLSTCRISALTLRLQANNLKTWAAKEWKGLDPETVYANMPTMPSYSLGVNISF